MTDFQLDQNLNARRMADACNAEGLCTLRRLPKRLINKTDDIVLRDLLGRDATLITADRRIVDENPSDIPPRNPGVVVVRLKVATRTLTARLADEMIRRFKDSFPEWHRTDWSRLFLEITDQDIYIARLASSDTSGGRTLRFDEPDFAAELSQTIALLRAALPP